MANVHSFKYLKYSLIILILYNIISLIVLFLPYKSLKYSLWNVMPYDYKYLVNYPNNFKNLSLLNSRNREFIKEGLNKNSSRNILNINYWNYNLIIDSYSKGKNKNFEKSFLNLFFLTKKNKTKNIDLKKYFILNYDYFSDRTKTKIIKNY